jgi:hypothetical protein
VPYADIGIRHNVVVVRELFVADGTDAPLQPDLAVQQLPHLCWRSEFAISSRMMRIFDPLNSESYQLGLSEELPATTRKGFMDWAQFIVPKSHGTPLDG